MMGPMALSPNKSALAGLLYSWLVLLYGCSAGPGNLNVSRVTDLEARNINRIGVLPPVGTPAEPKVKIPYSSSSPSDAKSADQDAPELLAGQLYASMVSLPGWQIIAERETREVAQTISSSNELERLKKIGAAVYADAMISGRILRYRERVGGEMGVKSPASVSFIVDLVDVRRGDVVWSARYDETQQSLSENILNLGEIGQRGIRWLTAEQLMNQGVRRAVGQLNQMLVRRPAP
jgi:hypothetical protein